MAEKRDKTIEKIRKSLELAVKNSGVQIEYQEAKAINSNTILADKEYKVQEIVYATGSKPREIKGLEFDEEFILSSDDVLKLDKLPKSVLIIGSGAIGIEWVRIFSNFGVEVAVVELAEHLIPLADIEVSKRIERIFKQTKIKYYVQDCVNSILNNTVTLKSGTIIEPDFILSAVGREPLKIENFNCKVLGDACAQIQLAHYAVSQGLKFAEGDNTTLDKNLIPSVIYGEPEIAWVGLRRNEAIFLLPETSLRSLICE